MKIKAGDTVKVTTQDKKEYSFKVDKISEDYIEGGNNKILFSDISEVKKSTEDNSTKIDTETSSYLKVLQFLDDVYFFYYLEY